MALDWADGRGDVSAFVLSEVAVSHDVVDQALHVFKRIEGGVAFQSVRLLAPGRAARSHDSHELVVRTEVEMDFHGCPSVKFGHSRSLVSLSSGSWHRLMPAAARRLTDQTHQQGTCRAPSNG